MNREFALKVADAVLYEGYMLYPYRPSALKNRQRWSFGILYPPDYDDVRRGTERSSLHSECLIRTKGDPRLSVQLRFLHLGSKHCCDNSSESWDEGVARSVEFAPDVQPGPQRFDFSFPESCATAEVQTKDNIVTTQHMVRGRLTCSADAISQDLLKVSIHVNNQTQCPPDVGRDAALLRALLSAHLILGAEGGEFVSLLDPPEELRGHVSACRNTGNFPVLVGTEGERDMMLCSPIILYDYPQIAPESAGDFYDSTEMDEMLTLRVMTLSDPEKEEMRLAGEHARRLLERTEQTAREQLMKTHGTIRSFRPVTRTQIPGEK